MKVDGHDHSPLLAAPDRIPQEFEKALTGASGTCRRSERALKTVLFTDIVSSTARAAAMGDRRWRVLLQRFDELTKCLVDRFYGTVVKRTGDGHLATFDGPTPAICCAEALRSETESLDIQIRIGVHTGECELIGDDIGGIAVHIAARILSLAETNSVWVSRTVTDLVAGSGITFADRGKHDLKGLPAEWQLFAAIEPTP